MIVPYNKMLLRESGDDLNEPNKCENEKNSIFRSINSRSRQDSYIRVLVQLCKIKIWKKC